ncbi:sialic acid-binding Ig-like lectin 15 [Mustelus asterias]
MVSYKHKLMCGNVMRWQYQKLKNDASGNDLVVNGTEGASVTLPCMFTPHSNYSMTTVSWMRKEPYQHVVTFRVQSDGSWTTVNGGNRYEFIGNLNEGNASIRINQLSVNDDYTYLCLVEYTSSNSHHLILNETRLQVTRAAETFPIVILCIPLGVKLLPLLVMWIVLYRDRTRKEQDRPNAGS